MKKYSKMNRRQFLTIVSSYYAGSIIPSSLFNFYNHNIKKRGSVSVQEIPNIPAKYKLPLINVIGIGGAGVNIINSIFIFFVSHPKTFTT